MYRIQATKNISHNGGQDLNNKMHSGPQTSFTGLTGVLSLRLPFDYKWSITGLLVHLEAMVTLLHTP